MVNRFFNSIREILLLDVAYGIAYKQKTENYYSIKEPTDRYSYADPFVVEHDGKTAIFVELMDYHYGWGTIGVFEIKDHLIFPVKEIIRENNHMSFPNVFCHEDELYMIVETYSAGNVHLYHCKDFPYEWEFDSVILDEGNLVDHALVELDGVTYVISYDLSLELSRCFILDWKKKELIEFFPEGDYCKERPGGTFFYDNGILKRVIQDCKEIYGDYIKIYKVLKLNENVFEEEFEQSVKITDIKFDNMVCFQHMHQYSVSNQYEVIDYWYKRVYFNKGIRFFVRVLFHPNRHFS